MIDSFKKLKNRELKKRIAYSALMGISVGVLIFGVLFLIFKLTETPFPWYGYAISGAVGALVSVLLLWVFYPTDKRYARTLDCKYGLGERVQTMVEFAGQEGAVLELQREQTEQALRALPTLKKDWKWAVKLFVLPLLATSVLVTSLAIPKPKQPQPATPPPPSGEEPFEWDEWVKLDLETLIANVQSSTLTDNLKPAYVLLLEELLDKLTAETPPTQKEMLTAVKGGMDLLIDLTKTENSYNAYVSAIKENKPNLAWTGSLATALTESAKAYEKVDGTDKRRFEKVQACTRVKLQAPIEVSLQGYADEVRGKIADYGQAEYISFVNDYTAELDLLFAHGGVAALADDEGITTELLTLKTALQDTVGLFDEGYILSAVKGSAGRAFDAFIRNTNGDAGVILTLAEQANTVLIKDYTLYTLGYIFDVAVPNEDEELEEGRDPNETPPDEDEYLYDGMILDPITNTFVSYHELVSRYRETLNRLLEADAAADDPQITKELETQIKAFLKTLEQKN